jgi:hypothetical protein
MSTTLHELGQHLDRRDWRYQVDQERSLILTGVAGENIPQLGIVIKLSEDGEYVQFVTPQLLQVPEHPHKAALLQTMLHICYEKKMLRFEYDRRDGEVRAAIELPLKDMPLTDRLFDRCLSGLIFLVDQQAMPRLQAVLETGIDSGDRNTTELLTSQLGELAALLDGLPPELRSQLEGLVMDGE